MEPIRLIKLLVAFSFTAVASAALTTVALAPKAEQPITVPTQDEVVPALSEKEKWFLGSGMLKTRTITADPTAHLTGWQGLSGGAWFGATPVKTIPVAPSTYRGQH